MTYGNLRADCQYTGISSGPKARYEVWESLYLFGRSLVKRFAVCYRTVVLSVTLMYCGQTVGRIKMKLGMQIGLGHIVLDADPAPPQKKRGHSPQILGPCLLWPTVAHFSYC